MRAVCFVPLALAVSCSPGGGGGTAQATPTNFTATATGRTSVALAWSDVSNESGYKIERRLASDTQFAPVGEVGADATTFNDTGLSARTEYTYRMRAANNAANSAYTDAVTIKTLGNPEAPTDLVGTPQPFSVALGWTDASDDETEFVVQLELNGEFVDYETLPPDTDSTGLFGLSALTTYSFRIIARNEDGDSAPSNELEITTTDPAPVLTAITPNTAFEQARPTVSVLGSGFGNNGATGTNRVLFDGVWGTDLREFGDRGLEVTAPTASRTGPVDVTVANVNGSTTLTDGFVFFQRPTLFGADTRLDTGGSSVRNDQHVIARSGNHVSAAWSDLRANSTSADLYFARSVDGGQTWLAEQRIDSDPGSGDATHPTIATFVDRVFVAWQDSRNGNPDIYVNASVDHGATWSGEKLVSTDPAGPGTNTSDTPLLRLEDTANVYVTWNDDRTPDTTYFNRSVDGGATWGTPTSLGRGSAQMEVVGGHVHVVLRDLPSISYISSTDGGASWSTPRELAQTIGFWVNFCLCNYDLVVTWIDDSGLTPIVFGRRSTDDGKTWSPSFQLSTMQPSLSKLGYLQLAASRDTMVAAWVTWDDLAGKNSLFVNVSPDNGATWQSTEIAIPGISSTAALGLTDLQLAISQANVFLAWTDENAAYLSTSTDGGLTWDSSPSLFAPGASKGLARPRLAVDGAAVNVLYADNRALFSPPPPVTPYRIYSARNKPQ